MNEQESQEGNRIAGSMFVIDEIPHCFWDRENSDLQLRFLDGIDAQYFNYIVQVNLGNLAGEHKHRSALAIRIAYSHALETLFALIGAAMQAPECPAGWMLRYRISDLTEILKKISDYEPVKNRWDLDRPDWFQIAHALIPAEGNDERFEALSRASGKLWKSLANEMLDGSREDEYNSLKHGLRVRSGNWYFALGREDIPGVPAPKERMRTMSRSDYGSSFSRAINLRKHNWIYEEQRINWTPEVIAKRIELIVASIDNVIARIRLCLGVNPEEVVFAYFDESMVTEALTETNHGAKSRFSHRIHFEEDALPLITAADIRSSYEATF